MPSPIGIKKGAPSIQIGLQLSRQGIKINRHTVNDGIGLQDFFWISGMSSLRTQRPVSLHFLQSWQVGIGSEIGLGHTFVVQPPTVNYTERPIRRDAEAQILEDVLEAD
jgi:hypothetical protein